MVDVYLFEGSDSNYNTILASITRFQLTSSEGANDSRLESLIASCGLSGVLEAWTSSQKKEKLSCQL